MSVAHSPVFVTTHWSVVLDARNPDSSRVNDALEALCRTYWYPLYAYLRRRGHSPEGAEDLTQGFFACLIEKNYLRNVHREKGKFRSFLLTAINRFVSDQMDRERSQKRRGFSQAISIQAQEAEERYRLEPIDRLDAERLYERRWAMTVLDQAITQLKSEFAPDRQDVWSALEGFLVGEKQGVTYAEVADRLGVSEDAVKMKVLRMRQRCRALIREEIAQTVSTPAEVEEEYRALLLALRR